MEDLENDDHDYAEVITLEILNGHVDKKKIYLYNEYSKIYGHGGNHPIYLALQNGGNIALLELLIQAGLDINSLDECKETFLFEAFRLNNLRAMKVLASNPKLDYKVLNTQSQTAFFQACKLHNKIHEITREKLNYIPIINMFIEKILVRLENDNNEKEALYWKLVYNIVNKNLDYALLNKIKETHHDFLDLKIESPAAIALMLEQYEYVNILIYRGDNINAAKQSILKNFIAEIMSKQNIYHLEFSIYAGISLNENLPSTPPIILAIEMKNMKMLKILLENGAHVDQISSENKMTALCLASEMCLVKYVKLLLAYRANVNHQDSMKNTPLHQVFLGESLSYDLEGDIKFCSKILKLLLDHECKINIKNLLGITPLMLAALHGPLDAIIMLLEYGADVKACDNNGKSTLHYGFQNTDSRVFKTMLRYSNINVNKKDLKGNTILSNAYDLTSLGHPHSIQISCISIARALRRNFNINIKNDLGEFPDVIVRHLDYCSTEICPLFEFYEIMKLVNPTCLDEGNNWIDIACRKISSVYSGVKTTTILNFEQNLQELQKMKQERVFITHMSEMTVYDIISFKARSIIPRIFAKNKNLEALQMNFLEEYPRLGVLLINLVEGEKERERLQNVAFKGFSLILDSPLTPDLMEEIFAHLANSQLKKFQYIYEMHNCIFE